MTHTPSLLDAQRAAQDLLQTDHATTGAVFLALLDQVTVLLDTAQTASRYLHHLGANHTEQGKPHPQALLLTQLDTAIASLRVSA